MDLQKSLQLARGNGLDFKKIFRTFYLKKQLYYSNGKVTDFYLDKYEYDKFLESFSKKLNNIYFLKNYEKNVLSVFNESLKKSKFILGKLDDSGSNAELVKFFKDFNDIWHKFYPWGLSLFYMTSLESIVKEKLKKYFPKEDELIEILNHIVYPYKNTPIMQEQADLLKAVEDIENGEKDILILSKKLSSKYGWMSVYNFTDKPRWGKYYESEIKRMLASKTDSADKIKQINFSKKINKIKFLKVIKKINDSLLKEQLLLLHKVAYLRDKREEVRDRLTINAKIIYEYIANKTSFSLEEVVNLYDDEIEKILKSDINRKKIQGKARKRKKVFSFMFSEQKIIKLDNEKILSKIGKDISITKESSIIKGQVAFGNDKKINGRVRVVLNNRDIGKVKKKEILVTSMTKPDYLPAIKISKAVITDEGGVTSHAAIICRELGIPCIIGTKIATRVLKDGDLVEVDANKGTVKILK